MKVRMLTHIVGTPAYVSGQVVELERRVAFAWIEEGYCIAVRDDFEAGDPDAPAADRAERR